VRHKFVVAYGPWRLFLERAGYRAITMPWRSIYVLSAHWGDEALRQHELVHIAQIERLGSARFSVVYLFYLARYGYRENPLEKEAYGDPP
jgi:hypothetical protein